MIECKQQQCLIPLHQAALTPIAAGMLRRLLQALAVFSVTVCNSSQYTSESGLCCCAAAELDRRRHATSTPDMKLVISMSYGSYAETEFSKAAIKSLAKQRSDVLWIAAAGNSGDNSTNYPAGYDEVSCGQQVASRQEGLLNVGPWQIRFCTYCLPSKQLT